MARDTGIPRNSDSTREGRPLVIDGNARLLTAFGSGADSAPPRISPQTADRLRGLRRGPISGSLGFALPRGKPLTSIKRGGGGFRDRRKKQPRRASQRRPARLMLSGTTPSLWRRAAAPDRNPATPAFRIPCDPPLKIPDVPGLSIPRPSGLPAKATQKGRVVLFREKRGRTTPRKKKGLNPAGPAPLHS